MIRRTLLTLTCLLASSSHAFAPMIVPRSATTTPISSISTSCTTSSSSSSALGMASDLDFPTAMPDKPTLSMEERLQQSATDFVLGMHSTLGEGVAAPPELAALEKAKISGAGAPELALRVYELMIERGMLYDEAPETGVLTPTEFSIMDNLDVQEVKDEFSHLYKYGMMLMNRELLTSDQLKATVVERLIKRTGLTPEKFDEWLGY